MVNQVLKDRVYRQGNTKWKAYIEELTQMDTLERSFMDKQCAGMTDENVKAELNVTEKQFNKIEESVAKKLLWGVLYCIDYTMRNDK